MSHLNTAFHFQPFGDDEVTTEDNAPLLYNSKPPGRKGRVTVFFRTRRTQRHRMGLHDLGQIDLAVEDSQQEIAGEEMKRALNKMTTWRYLFPPESANPPLHDRRKRVDSREFQSLVDRTLAV